jgi:NTE family protein
MSDNRRISLVLSSGGARGLVHIGAIQCLEQQGYDISCVAGSSMGALVGGIYARGKLDVFAEWVSALTRNDVMRLVDIGWGVTGGLIKGERIVDVLKDLIGDDDIESLPIAFTAVATDINRKREVWIDRGPLFEAIRASIAIPMVFTPVRRGSQILIDGGVLNPLPIAPTLKDDTGLTVAVDVNGVDERRLNARLPLADSRVPSKPSSDHLEPSVRQAIVDFIEGLWPGGEVEEAPRPTQQNMFDIAMEAMDAMQVTISRLKSSVYTPDVLVQIPRNVAHFFEFERAEELIELGHRLMAKELTPAERA